MFKITVLEILIFNENINIILNVWQYLLFVVGSDGPRGLAGIQGERGLPGDNKKKFNKLILFYK